MEFYFTENIKWSDINPLNHAIRNEYAGNLMNLAVAVCEKVKKKNLSVVSGFVCGKLARGVHKDEELRQFVEEGRCIGFTYDGYSIDEFILNAKNLKKIGVGFYLTPICFYAILNSDDVKWKNDSKWEVVNR
jgi:hypothetical protein